MRKRWMYVFAFSLMLGATPVFTGCIDNDEPAGISELRGAKAELLKAKAAVEAAKVAKIQAEASLIEAKAKVQEAEAVKREAEAKIKEAEAAIKQAKADYWAAKTEEQRAIAQGKIEENERIQKEWEEKAAVRQAEAEAAIKKAEYDALTAKANYEAVLLALKAAQEKVLQPYMADLDLKMSNYFDALNNLRLAQRKYNEYQKDAAYEEANKEFYTREAEWNVIEKTSLLELERKSLEDASAALEEAKDMQPSELLAKAQDYDKQIQNTYIEAADLNLAIIEKAYGDYNLPGRVKEEEELLKKYNEISAYLQTIPEITFDLTDAVYPISPLDKEITRKESSYSMIDQSNYNRTKKWLNKQIEQFESWKHDDNDDLWSQSAIADLESELVGLQNTMDDAKIAWEEAVAAYSANDFKAIDLTKLASYNEFVAVLDKYNEVAASLNSLNAAVSELTSARLEAQVAQSKAIDDADVAYRIESNRLYDKLQDDNSKANTTCTAKKQELLDIKNNLDTKQAAAKTDFETEFNSNGWTPKAYELLAAWSELNTKFKDAEKAYNEYDVTEEIGKLVAANQKQYETDLETAQNTFFAAEKKANEDYEAVWNPDKGTKGTLLSKAYNDRFIAYELLMNDVSAAIKTTANAFNKDLQAAGGKAIRPNWVISQLIGGYVLEDDGADELNANAIPTDFVAVTKADLEKVVIARSEALYGKKAGKRLAPMTKEDILAKAQDDLEDNLASLAPDADLYEEYLKSIRKYGSAGKVYAMEVKIENAKNMMNNSEAVDKKIAQAMDALKAMEEAFDALELSQETASNDYWALVNTNEQAWKELWAPYYNKLAEIDPLEELRNAAWQAVMAHNQQGDPQYSQENIDNYIASLQNLLAAAEKRVYDAETNLMKAKKELAEWNAGTLDRLQVLANRVEDAQALVDRRKSELDTAQSRLDAIIAQLEVE